MNHVLQTMKKAWLGCLGSLASLIIGGTLLLLFMNLYTVPHVLTSMFQKSTCRLVAVCPIQTSESNTTTGLPLTPNDIMTKNIREITMHPKIDHGIAAFYNEDICRAVNDRYPQYTSSSNSSHCPYMFIVVHTEHLLTEDGDQVAEDNIHMTAESEHVTEDTSNVTTNFNDKIAYIKYVQSLIKDTKHVHPLIEDSWHFYMHTENQSRCPCPSCHFSSESHHLRPYIAHTPLSVRNSWSCHVDAPGHILWRRQSTLVILNVMLWPTLLVIVGFVGAFFGWLNLQYEHSCGICNMGS